MAGGVLLYLAGTVALAAEPGLGQPLPAEAAAAGNLTVLPDGRGLPPGAGDPTQGERVYALHCRACHGEAGGGGPNDALVGRADAAGDPGAPRTIGNYWPYATTVFDYVRRAMPYQSPGTLSDDDVYAVTAYLLYRNGIIDADTRLDASALPRIVMPNRNGFQPAHR